MQVMIDQVGASPFSQKLYSFWHLLLRVEAQTCLHHGGKKLSELEYTHKLKLLN